MSNKSISQCVKRKFLGSKRFRGFLGGWKLKLSAKDARVSHNQVWTFELAFGRLYAMVCRVPYRKAYAHHHLYLIEEVLRPPKKDRKQAEQTVSRHKDENTYKHR